MSRQEDVFNEVGKTFKRLQGELIVIERKLKAPIQNDFRRMLEDGYITKRQVIKEANEINNNLSNLKGETFNLLENFKLDLMSLSSKVLKEFVDLEKEILG